MVPSLSTLFHFGVSVLKTTVSEKTKSIVAQLGDVVSEVVDSDNAEWWQHVGFVSRPPKPAPGEQACQAVGIRTSSNDVILATRDLRGQTLSGQIGDGETCVYAAGATGTAQGRVLLKSDGSVNVFTRDGNTDAGQAVIIRVGADSGIDLQSKYGAIKIASDGITLTAGSAALKLGSDGRVTLGGQVVQVRGQVALFAGQTATLIGQSATPVVATGAAYSIAGPANVISTNVFISP
jgi:hypothetical protein